MTVAELFQGLPGIGSISKRLATTEVKGLEYDSRRVEPGFLFFAFSGANADGRTFASKAIEAGAIGVVSQELATEEVSDNWIQVQHGRKALAEVAGRFYGNPDRNFNITGITGTNGKTTTCYVADSIWRAAGRTTALLGTIGYQLAGQVLPSVNTTPESLDLYRLFVELRRKGGSNVTMEVSSHALELGRVYGVHFHTAVFTNLTRDHLDFHGSMENYLAAKQILFMGAGTSAPKVAIVNYDDPHGRSLRFNSDTEVVWYGLAQGAAACAEKISSTFEGLRFQVKYRGQSYPLESAMVGQVNVYNILAAWCTAITNGIAPEVAARGIEQCSGVPGRFERIREGQPFLVVVDYAHTDDALRNTISIARALTKRRVITLFGCGGDRDRTKRPLMGMAAAELSDLVILTSDNPRSEDPLAIMNDAMVGLRRFDTALIVEPDRERAIRKAIEAAGSGDVVLLAGKGHETYQVLKDSTIHFDDREVAANLLRQYGYGKKNREHV